MIAMGILPCESRSAYVTDAWNLLDGVIVALSWVSLTLAENGGVSALRSVRVLRPLRTISHVRGMRLLVAAMLSSIPALADVLILFG